MLSYLLVLDLGWSDECIDLISMFFFLCMETLFTAEKYFNLNTFSSEKINLIGGQKL